MLDIAKYSKKKRNYNTRSYHVQLKPRKHARYVKYKCHKCIEFGYFFSLCVYCITVDAVQLSLAILRWVGVMNAGKH